jgi:DNA polymerase-3 subunit epsilon
VKNRYSGTCASCRARVPAEAGQAVNEAGQWLVYHDDCVPVRTAPQAGTHAGWHDGPIVAFDVETTLPEPLDARVVSAALVHSDGTSRSWLVNPGVPIPPDATDRNGITDEMVRRDGQPAAAALAEIGTLIGKYIADGVPVVAYFASYDVTVLHTELARHALPAIDWSLASIIDPFVLHKQAEPKWFGSKTLGDLCGYYQIQLVNAHEAASDAAAALGLARGIAARHQRIAQVSLSALHQAQIRWFAEQSRDLQQYYDRRGIQKTVSTEWPLETVRRG